MKGALVAGKAKTAVPLNLGNIDNDKWNRLLMAKFDTLMTEGFCMIDTSRPSKIRIHNIGYEGLKIMFGRNTVRKKRGKNMIVKWVRAEMKYIKNTGNWKFNGDIGVWVRGVDGVWRAQLPVSGVVRQQASNVNASNQ